jgi:large subunit ribosomal protein L17
MLRNLASSLFLTERDADDDQNKPKVKGRVVTTIQKAKEVRPLVERCITLACRTQSAIDDANQYTTTAQRNTEAWRAWRKSPKWKQWAKAVRILFSELAPRFVGRSGGYTRILRLAKPRLGDAGTRAILEFVGVRDRVRQKAQRPAFEPVSQTEGTTS